MIYRGEIKTMDPPMEENIDVMASNDTPPNKEDEVVVDNVTNPQEIIKEIKKPDSDKTVDERIDELYRIVKIYHDANNKRYLRNNEAVTQRLAAISSQTNRNTEQNKLMKREQLRFRFSTAAWIGVAYLIFYVLSNYVKGFF